MVSVCCLTYNHEKYIRDAFDGFLMQQTDFPFEIWVHDDASTDNTQEIIREYAARHPDLFKTILQKENQRSQGRKVLSLVMPRCRGKYIAFCEGDDYWTDPRKLQKQVDFLETHPDFTVCFHRSLIKYEDQDFAELILPPENFSETLGFEDIARTNFITTASVVYRNGFVTRVPAWAAKIAFVDWTLHLLVAQHGKIKFLKDVMSVYRIHSGGLWNGAPRRVQMQYQVEGIEQYIKHFKPLGEETFRREGGKVLAELCETLFREGSYREFRKYGKKARLMSRFWTREEKRRFAFRYFLCFFPALAERYR
jgi:glycosyltransferase involved in cell wall biosynthesis